MSNLQDPYKMGSSNQNISQVNNPTPVSNITTQQPDKQRISQQINNNRLTPQQSGRPQSSIITTTIDQYRATFSLANNSSQITIKCTSKKSNKRYFCSYSYEQLPKATQVTYKSVQQLYEQIKYIVDEKIMSRLTITEEGKLVFNLETKKKGKSEYIPEVFQMEEENQERLINRLEEDIQMLKAEDNRKNSRITQLQQRIVQIESILNVPHKQSNKNNDPYQTLNMNTPLNTIQSQMNDNFNTQQSQISQQSIIKKFKKTKSNQDISLKSIQPQQSLNGNSQNQIKIQQSPQVLNTRIKDYDCFFELDSNNQLKIQLLSRRQAKISKCTISPETIPKAVYSFVPTPQKLYDQIRFLIEKNIKDRLDVIDNNFIYRASINQKNHQVLVDGVFQMEIVQQNDVERIEELIDIKTSTLETDVKELKLQFQLLKISLQTNGLILSKPQTDFNSKIIQTNEDYITVFKFFKSKVFKIDLLYRASQNNFQIKKFHEKCDGIPNTLTVVLTQFGKKIGGFTAQQWDRNGNGKSVSDYQSHSFIFSLTNRHKFNLEQHEHAIQTGAEDGPRFGNGADLVIKDKAHQNSNSYANIGTSYTHSRYTYKHMDSYKYFSGDDKTNRFGVKQWQVFEVFFQE